MGTYYDIQEKLIILAELDESEDYEVDYTLIGYEKEMGKFVLVTASGCSCWDGEADVEYYDTLSDLQKSIGVFGKEREFNPSLKGAERAIYEAMENMKHFPVGIKSRT